MTPVMPGGAPPPPLSPPTRDYTPSTSTPVATGTSQVGGLPGVPMGGGGAGAGGATADVSILKAQLKVRKGFKYHSDCHWFLK